MGVMAGEDGTGLAGNTTNMCCQADFNLKLEPVIKLERCDGFLPLQGAVHDHQDKNRKHRAPGQLHRSEAVTGIERASGKNIATKVRTVATQTAVKVNRVSTQTDTSMQFFRAGHIQHDTQVLNNILQCLASTDIQNITQVLNAITQYLTAPDKDSIAQDLVSLEVQVHDGLSQTSSFESRRGTVNSLSENENVCTSDLEDASACKGNEKETLGKLNTRTVVPSAKKHNGTFDLTNVPELGGTHPSTGYEKDVNSLSEDKNIHILDSDTGGSHQLTGAEWDGVQVVLYNDAGTCALDMFVDVCDTDNSCGDNLPAEDDTVSENELVALDAKLLAGIEPAEAILSTESYTSAVEEGVAYKTNKRGGKRYDCDQCNAGFNSVRFLKRHLVVHSDKKPFTCSQCAALFKTKDSLGKHVRTLHPHVKPYICQCGASFGRFNTLRMHKKKDCSGISSRDRHVCNHSCSGDRHVCNQCNADFDSLTFLERHMVIHSDERPFRCSHCSSSFKRRNALRYHERTIHPYVIEDHSGQCSEKIKRYVCDQCNASFHFRKFFKRHLTFHSDERPFKCSHCTVAFKSYDTMRKHVKTHSGLKRHACECGAAFYWPYQLENHLKQKKGQSGRCKKYISLEKHSERTYGVERSFKRTGVARAEKSGVSRENDKAKCMTASDSVVLNSTEKELAQSVNAMSGNDSAHNLTSYMDSSTPQLQNSSSELESSGGVLFEEGNIRAQSKDGSQQGSSFKSDPVHGARNDDENAAVVLEKDNAPIFSDSDNTSKMNTMPDVMHSDGDRTETVAALGQGVASCHEHNSVNVDVCMPIAANETRRLRAEVSDLHQPSLFKSKIGPYACDICSKAFSWKRSLKEHQLSHPGRYKCCECTASFALRNCLLRHYNQHKRASPFTCQECRKTFLKRKCFREHMVMHSNERPFKCDQCPCAYKTISALNYHRFCKHVKKDEVFTCETCGAAFQREGSLRTHQRKHYEVHLCEYCGSAFSSFPCLKLHRFTHTGEKRYACQMCDMRFYRKQHLNVHMNKHSVDQPFKCEVCSFRCKSKKAFRHHNLKWHKGESINLFSCSVCSAVFKSIRTLNNHTKRHNGENPFRCHFCSFETFDKASFKLHLLTHTGEANVCQTCGKSFTSPHYLKSHMITHVKNKPFQTSRRRGQLYNKSKQLVGLNSKGCTKLLQTAGQYICNVCKSCHANEDSLRAHVREHMGERPYQCRICPSVFKDSKNLYAHSNVHRKPFSCKVCGRSYSSRRPLVLHRLKENHHTREPGERPYQCYFCPSVMENDDDFQSHLETHNKPYVCEMCHKRFAVLRDLRNHRLRENHFSNEPVEVQAVYLSLKSSAKDVGEK